MAAAAGRGAMPGGAEVLWECIGAGSGRVQGRGGVASLDGCTFAAGRRRSCPQADGLPLRRGPGTRNDDASVWGLLPFEARILARQALMPWHAWRGRGLSRAG